MALTNVLGNSPIPFTDADGNQLSIPLSVLQFDGGTVKPDGWPPFNSFPTKNKQALQGWLDSLVQSRAIVPDKAPPPKPAFVITAQDPGAAGNNITVTLDKIVPDTATPGDSKVDITVTEVDTYVGLTPATVGDVLGVDATVGKRPGLVHVKGPGPYQLPKQKDYSLAGGNGGKASIGIDKQTGPDAAFTLEAKAAGADGKAITVSIKDVDTTNQAFTLVASWTKTMLGVKLSDITSNFNFVIKVDPPQGGAFAPPVPATLALFGGADAAAATTAKATAIAG